MDLNTTSDTPTSTTATGITSFGDFAIGDGRYYNANWLYRQQITISASEVVGSDQSEFPVLIKLPSNTGLETYAQTTGQDILFTASDGVTVLPYEREEYTSSTGALVAWVMVPDLSHTANTVLYMYYGNATASEQQNAAGVWVNDYMSVWHLSQTSGTTFPDSTGLGNTGNEQNTLTLNAGGQIGPGVNFNTIDNDSGYISTTTDYGQNSNYLTASVWFKTSSASGYKMVGFENAQTGDSAGNYDRQIWMGENGDVYDGINPGTGLEQINSPSTYADGNYHYAVMTVGTSPNLTLYVDGSLVASASTGGPQSGYSGWWKIGAGNLSGWTEGQAGYFVGNLDEVHIASTNRTANWIATEYNNQKSPSTFITVGNPQQDLPYLTVTLPGQASANTGTPSGQIAGTPFNVTLTAYNLNGTIDTSINGAYTVTYSGPANAPGGQMPTYTTSVTFASGVSTTTLTTTLVDSQTTTISASISGVTGTGVASSSLTVGSGTANQLGFLQQPTTAAETVAISPAVTVQVLDQFGNFVTTSTAIVGLAIQNNPGRAPSAGRFP